MFSINKIKHWPPYIDRRAIVVFRVLLGGVILLDLFINKWPNIAYFYTEAGVYPLDFLDASIEGNPFKALQKLSLLSLFKSAAQVKMLFAVTGTTTLLYAFGYKPKWFGVATFVLLFSIHQRNQYVLSGPDELIISLLAWSLFLPLSNKNLKDGKPKLTSVASVGLIIQIALIYFYNADLKNGFVWQEGNGLTYALMEDLWVKPTAQFLLQFPGLCKWLSYGTIAVEYTIPVLILLPFKREAFRLTAAILLVLLHGTIFSFLTLGLFPLIAATIVVVTLPSVFWDKVFKPSTDSVVDAEKHNKYSLFGKAFSSVFLVLIVWKAILSHNHGDNGVYSPKFMQYLNQTTLFKQYWAMYAPNPTLYPSWYKVAVLTENGQFLDYKAKQPHKDDLSHIEEYKDYTWSLFFYWTFVYPDQFSEVMTQRWANLEKDFWNKNNPENKATYVYIYGFRKTIVSSGKALEPTKQIVAISK